MKKVAQHLFEVLVGVFSMSDPGASLLITFTDEKSTTVISKVKSIMPEEMLKSLTAAFSAKVHEYAILNPSINLSNLRVSVVKNDDGTFTCDSPFTGEFTLNGYDNLSEAVTAAMDATMAFQYDLEHELEASEV